MNWLAQYLAARIGRLIENRFSAVKTLIVVAVLSIMALAIGRQLRVNTNLEALLSPTAPSVVALDELRERQGSTEFLYIAVRSPDPAANQRLIADIKRELETWPETLDVFVDRDYTAIRNHALYTLSPAQLDELRDQLKRRRQIAIAKAMAALGEEVIVDEVLADDDWDEDFDDPEPDEAPPTAREDPPAEELDLDELLKGYREAVKQKIERGDLPLEPRDIDLIWPLEDEQGQLPWHNYIAQPYFSVDPSGYTHLLMARLSEPSTDLAFATEVNRRFDALLEQLDIRSYHPAMLAKIGGGYATSFEADTIKIDLRRATSLSAALVLSCLIVGFRRLRSISIVLAPVVIAVFITLALAYILLGELNILTAFLFAVLLGIGVDFSVHLFAIRETQGPEPDWPAVIVEHFPPLFASMLTTMGAFLLLTVADFRGFVEFGIIAAIGVTVCFVVSLVVVPALDVAIGPLRARGLSRWLRARQGPVPQAAQSRGAWVRALRKTYYLRVAIIAACAVVAVVGAPDVGFEKDLNKLRAPETRAQKGISYTRALGRGGSGTPLVILADDPHALEEALRRIRADANTSLVPIGSGKDYEGQPWVREVRALEDFLPHRQVQKHAIIKDIHRQVESILAELSDDLRDTELTRYRTHLEALEKLSSFGPIDGADLPRWATTPFREKDGRIDRIALLSYRIPTWDLESVVRLTQHFRSLTADLDVRGASSRFILADVTVQVEEDAKRLPPLALTAILAVIALWLRRTWAVIACFGSLLLGLALTFGVMGLWSIDINFYNLVVMPAVVGLGIDASIHLWHARQFGGLQATSKAALISALTTAGGFAGLLVSQHLGLRSIGLLGVVATLGCVLVAVVLLGVGPRGSAPPPVR